MDLDQTTFFSTQFKMYLNYTAGGSSWTEWVTRQHHSLMPTLPPYRHPLASNRFDINGDNTLSLLSVFIPVAVVTDVFWFSADFCVSALQKYPTAIKISSPGVTTVKETA